MKTEYLIFLQSFYRFETFQKLEGTGFVEDNGKKKKKKIIAWFTGFRSLQSERQGQKRSELFTWKVKSWLGVGGGWRPQGEKFTGCLFLMKTQNYTRKGVKKLLCKLSKTETQ